MAHLAPLGPVYQAGTLSGNPLATAAGLAALAELDAAAYARLDATAARLADGLPEAFARQRAGRAGAPGRVRWWGCSSPTRPVRNFDDAREAGEGGCYRRFFHAMLRQGIALAPGPYEVLFPSLAHTAADIERTVEAAGRAAREVAAGLRLSTPAGVLRPQRPRWTDRLGADGLAA